MCATEYPLRVKEGPRMDTRARVLTVAMSLILLVSLTMACSLPGLPSVSDVIPSEEETPETAAPPAEEPAADEAVCGDGVCEGPETQETCPQDCGEPEGETPPEEQLPFDLDVDALDSLSSYAYTLHIDVSTSEVTGEMVLDIEGRRQATPTRAEYLKFSSTSDGTVTDMEMIYIEEQGKAWMREGGGAWQEIPAMQESVLQMFDSFSMLYWWDELFVGDPEDAQYVGQEVVNGVASHHYRAAESSGLGALTVGCSFVSYEDDVWVAVDGSFPVKRQMSAQGDCQGESGAVNFSMEISEVNQPLNITPPT
jgi:hypothetical protein